MNPENKCERCGEEKCGTFCVFPCESKNDHCSCSPKAVESTPERTVRLEVEKILEMVYGVEIVEVPELRDAILSLIESEKAKAYERGKKESEQLNQRTH